MSSNSFLSQGIRTSPAFRELPGSGRTAEARSTRHQLCRHGVGDLFSAVHSGQLDWEGRSPRSLALSLEERPGCPGTPPESPTAGAQEALPTSPPPAARGSLSNAGAEGRLRERHRDGGGSGSRYGWRQLAALPASAAEGGEWRLRGGRRAPVPTAVGQVRRPRVFPRRAGGGKGSGDPPHALSPSGGEGSPLPARKCGGAASARPEPGGRPIPERARTVRHSPDAPRRRSRLRHSAAMLYGKGPPRRTRTPARWPSSA